MSYCRISPRIKVFIFFLLLLALVTHLAAQPDSRLRMANLFKNTGNYAEALELYLQVYRSGQSSGILVNDIQFCYEKLKRYDDLINFLKELVKSHPGNLDYQVRLGKAFYLNGQRKTAFDHWQQLMQTHAQNAYLYRLLGNTFIELRLYDKAIETYQTAIEKTNSQFSLYRDIALLYRAQLDYGQAALNYLKFLEHFPNQVAFVNSQIIAMSSDTTAVRQMITAIENYLNSHRQKDQVKQMLADLYLRNKDFKRAFAIYQQLHQKAPKFNYLSLFVNKAIQNNAYDFAIKGLLLLEEQSPKSFLKKQYQLQLAKTYYLKGKKQAALKKIDQSQKSVQKALTLLKNLTQDEKARSAPYFRQALELRGDIYFNYYEDIDQAIANYRLLLNTGLRNKQLDMIRLKLARAYLAKGDLQRAKEFLLKIQSGELRNLRSYWLAELLFYQGKLSAALKQFKTLTKKIAPDDTLKNNLLERTLLLQHVADDSATLVDFARAEFLIMQKKRSQAAHIFKEIAFRERPLSPLCAERAVKLFVQLNKFDEVEEIVKHVLKAFPHYANLDYLLFTLAQIQERQQQYKQAFDNYRLVISQFPNSFWIDRCREQARLLKEKLKTEQMP